jgi:LysR family transcriptional regulator for metE and metH
MDVQVNMEAAGRPLEALMNGEIDLAVINQLAPGNKQFSSRLVIRDEMMAVFAPTHPLARKEYLEVEDFAGQEVLVYTPQADSFLLRRLLAPQKIRAKRVFEMPLTEDLVRMASASSAVALLPRWAFLPYLERYPVEARRVTQTGTHREWNAVVLKHSKSPSYFSKFIELMASKLNAIVGDAGKTASAPKIARVNGRTAAASVTC